MSKNLRIARVVCDVKVGSTLAGRFLVRCGENVGKIGYKNGLQVSVGHLRVPGAGIEPARIAPLVFETSASTDSAIRAFALFRLPVGGWLTVRKLPLITRSERGAEGKPSG